MSVHEIGWHKTRSISHCHQKMRSILLDRQLHGRHNWTILNQLSQSKSEMCVHLPQSRIERAVHNTTHRTSKRIYTSINIHIEVCMLKSGNTCTPTQTHTLTMYLKSNWERIFGLSLAHTFNNRATNKESICCTVTWLVVGWYASDGACSIQVSREPWFVSLVVDVSV